MTKLTDAERVLLASIRKGRRIPVRGDDRVVAEGLDRRAPGLIATGSLGEDLVIGITGEGLAALEEAEAGRG